MRSLVIGRIGSSPFRRPRAPPRTARRLGYCSTRSGIFLPPNGEPAAPVTLSTDRPRWAFILIPIVGQSALTSAALDQPVLAQERDALFVSGQPSKAFEFGKNPAHSFASGAD